MNALNRSHPIWLWTGMALAMIAAFAVAVYVNDNRTSSRPECYRMLVDDYATQQPLINRLMSDGRLTNAECDTLMDAGAKSFQKERQAESQHYIQEYQALKSGHKINNSEDDD